MRTSHLEVYKSLKHDVATINNVFGRLTEEFSKDFDDLYDLERQVFEKQVNKVKSKGSLVSDVTEETPRSNFRLFSDQHPVVIAAALSQAKVKARPLLKRFHPDTGGNEASPERFQMVRDAIATGDLECIHLLLHAQNCESEGLPSLDTVVQKVQQRQAAIRKSRAWKVVSLFYSNAEECRKEVSILILERKQKLFLQLHSA